MKQKHVIHNTRCCPMIKPMQVLFFLSMLMLFFVNIDDVYAGSTAVYSNEPREGTCTSEPQYEIEPLVPGTGLITQIVESISIPLNQLAEVVFVSIAGDSGFRNVVRVASSIFIAVYGIMFMLGMVQLTAHDLIMRLVKIGIMNILISGNAWAFFSGTVVRFFNGGVDALIAKITQIGFANAAGGSVGIVGVTGAPFDPLDNALLFLVSTKMVVTLIATFFTGPYGLIIGFILLMSLGAFLKAIFNALWVYVMALVVRTLMFGLAPIFLVCLLFSRTRHLFEGWLNQIVNASLQPVFLFTFFTFFVTLLAAALSIILDRPVCLMPAEIQVGTPQVWNTWRFAIRSGCGVDNWVPFDGMWDFDGVDLPQEMRVCNPEIHPLGIILPLMIWILADLAGRFNHIVIEIAKDLANASTDLSMGAGQVGSWFANAAGQGNAGLGKGGGPGTTGQRGAPASLDQLNKMLDNSGSGSKPGQIPPTRGGPPSSGGSTPPPPSSS